MPSSAPTACALSASGPQRLPGLCLETLKNHQTSWFGRTPWRAEVGCGLETAACWGNQSWAWMVSGASLGNFKRCSPHSYVPGTVFGELREV